MRIEKVTDCVSRRVPGARPQDKSSQDEKLSLRVAELAASPKMERVPRRRQILLKIQHLRKQQLLHRLRDQKDDRRSLIH
jgi:hypothetical protein